ncbi:hypothetical protein TL16_g03193 [Triparma laevis f. inornata]|uniref:Uncharacterized protein n=1 Tax=Triparma laevis f. inornata TaxID=1714386 RepID=A0A9W7A1C1_9STRA|nr:hypothetical protein TL16_g03193 [Triparma laevis f. inornata]
MRERSSSVSNMLLMSVSGFCRNCLTKWLTLSSRSLPETAHLPLDFFANYVYGEDPKAWKEKYNGTPSEELKSNYEASKSIHAKHDKKALEPKQPLQSNVCCKDADELCALPPPPSTSSATSKNSIPLPQPPTSTPHLNVITVIVSDRLYNNQYPDGDKCFPAIERCLKKFASSADLTITPPTIIPDDKSTITSTLSQKIASSTSTSSTSNPTKTILLTCGGTGFSPRDTTPEATLSLSLDKNFTQLISHSLRVSSEDDVMASLSRGVCGEKEGVFLCNLPGKPEGVEGVLEEVFKGVLWWAGEE